MPDLRVDPCTLQRDAALLGMTLTADQAAKIIEFGDRLLGWNRAFNLISRKDQDRLYQRHLLDSLSIGPWLSGTRILDLGTGAGLPGVPLAIACPHHSFTLVDRNERKVRFVRQSVRQLGLENVEVLCGDVVDRVPAAAFDVVVSRAVAAAESLWPLVRAALRPTGVLLVMASGQSHDGASLDANLAQDARIAARAALAIPGLARPHGLLIIEHAAAAVASSQT